MAVCEDSSPFEETQVTHIIIIIIIIIVIIITTLELLLIFFPLRHLQTPPPHPAAMTMRELPVRRKNKREALIQRHIHCPKVCVRV